MAERMICSNCQCFRPEPGVVVEPLAIASQILEMYRPQIQTPIRTRQYMDIVRSLIETEKEKNNTLTWVNSIARRAMRLMIKGIGFSPQRSNDPLKSPEHFFLQHTWKKLLCNKER